MRILTSDLDAVCRRINRTLNGTDETPVRVDGENAPDVFWISGAYGGYSLYRNSGAGAEDVFRCGHLPKRELYDRMQSFLTGVDYASRTPFDA